MAKRKPAIRLIPYLCWSLEGRRTFEQSRVAFVRKLDGLLSELAMWPAEAALTLGGQVRLVENYREVRPDREDDVREALATGRLNIGPWYVEPDVFLVSGEAIIRNLLTGKTVGGSLGQWTDVGLLLESSGAAGQLPQILAGFGILSAVVRRGVGPDASELWWEGPDGSIVTLFQLCPTLEPDATEASRSDLQKALREVRDLADSRSTLNPLIVFAGGEEGTLQAADLADILETAEKTSGVQVDISNVQDALDAARQEADAWAGVIGELRTSEGQPLWQGALSGRIWIKQRNAEIQTKLERWAEPFSTWERLLVNADPISAGLLRHAWRLLLLNHSPAALRGATVDAAADEISARFEQADQIASEIVADSLHQIASQVDSEKLGIRTPYLPVTVFNADDRPRSDVATFTVELPEEFGQFKIVDERGRTVPLEGLIPEDLVSDLPRMHVRFVAEEVPAFGYRTYGLVPVEVMDERGYGFDHEPTVENDWLSVAFDAMQGTFTIFDKRTGRSFPGLNHFSDGGDCGDLLSFCPPARDTVINVPTNTPLHVDRFISPVSQTLEYLEIFRLPERLTPGRDARLPLAAQFVPVSVTTSLTVYQEIPRVDVTVRVSSSAHDHRLRVHFPTGISDPTVTFAGHFEVVERDIRLPAAEETALWAEQPVPSYPHQGFVTLLGGETGLTIACPGLPDVSVLTHEENGAEIAITLLRSVGWLWRDDLPTRNVHPGKPVPAPDAQTTGEFEYHYSLIPHGQNLTNAWQLARAFQAPLLAVVGKAGGGGLPLSASIVSANNPAFIISGVKTAEADPGGVIIRGYNLTNDEQSVELAVGFAFEDAYFARMDESIFDEMMPEVDNDGRLNLTVRGHEIVTLLLTV